MYVCLCMEGELRAVKAKLFIMCMTINDDGAHGVLCMDGDFLPSP